MMNIERFNYEKHSEMVNGWLKKHSFPLPPKMLLSDIGFVVGETTCGFLYTTNSKMGWIEWVFSNPEKTKEERIESQDILFTILLETARAQGIAAIFSAASIPAYAKILERNEFNKTDENIVHYIKLLGGK